MRKVCVASRSCPEPHWSARGSRTRPRPPPGTNGQIAFTSLRDGDEEIYVMDADGSDETNLTSPA